MTAWFRRKKRVTPEELGRTLLMMAAGAARNSLNPLLQKVGFRPEDVSEMEYIVGHMFMIAFVVDQHLPQPIGFAVLEGIRHEYVETCRRGGVEETCANALFAQRGEEYTGAISNEAGGGPMWHLGVSVYRRVTGSKEPDLDGTAYISLALGTFGMAVKDVLNNVEIDG